MVGSHTIFAFTNTNSLPLLVCHFVLRFRCPASFIWIVCRTEIHADNIENRKLIAIKLPSDVGVTVVLAVSHPKSVEQTVEPTHHVSPWSFQSSAPASCCPYPSVPFVRAGSLCGSWILSRLFLLPVSSVS